jgi:homoserine O-succinyltransferase/O-acetyltransferase
VNGGRGVPFAAGEAADECLVIGLVNNTADRGLKATEAQFAGVLRAAARGRRLSIKLFSCPEIARSTPPQDCAGSPYCDFAEIFEGGVDALIVTGMEPQAASLRDEPVWGTITKLVDWAADHGIPTIWSCLAAHAAVLHLDGIARSRHGRKLSGVFSCEMASPGHPLAKALPSRWSTPHSRYHGLRETALAANGYQILSRSDAAGVDMFAKDHGASFLFFQGHPEYDPDTLMREYKRDLRRYHLGEQDDYPHAPRNYFDDESDAVIQALCDQVLRKRHNPEAMAEIFSVMDAATLGNHWATWATGLYANWLELVARNRRPSCDLRSWADAVRFAGADDGTSAVLR